MYVRKKLDSIAYSLSYQSLQFMPEFEVRVRVLKRLRYLGNEDQLKLKGYIWGYPAIRWVVKSLNSCVNLREFQLISQPLNINHQLWRSRKAINWFVSCKIQQRSMRQLVDGNLITTSLQVKRPVLWALPNWSLPSSCLITSSKIWK